MSMRYTQPKAEALKHTEILKAMLKRPENKSCADCKRNDPRWASTNLGCFMCIRCSGIHRGMGVHITRIKSVDLDTWTPEQIVHIQRWGNRRANAYWEAHLKAGHAPPEHKMESFIRSKYESRRWAMEGAVPEPESLDGPGDTAPPAATSSGGPTSTARPSARAAPSAAIDLLAGPPSSTSTTSRAAPSLPQLSAPSRSAAPSVLSVPAPSVKAPSGGGLFDLDFHAPAAPPAPVAKRDAKADILSLFAASPPPPSHNQQQFSNGISQGMGGLSLGGNGAGFGGSDPWGATTAGSSAGGGFGDFSDFGSASVAGRQPVQDTYAQPASTGAGSNPWGSPVPTHTTADPFGDFSAGLGTGTAKKADAFSDIWN